MSAERDWQYFDIDPDDFARCNECGAERDDCECRDDE